MKIQCDVCNKNHASLFCTADEAALCDACDHRVHHANKLASKHQRFSLTHPSSKHFPLCDVCQERRAYVFCQQDRAILCKECDLPIHAANEHTKKHNRFLLTGTKLSASATVHSSQSPPSSSKPQSSPVLDSSEASHPPLVVKAKACPCPSTASAPPNINKAGGSSLTNQNEEAGFTSGSSISEYLINTIPGWKFEDFLDSPSVPFAAFSKSGDGMSSLFDADIEEGNLVSFSAENMGGIWVPQAPSSSLYSTQIMDQQIGYRETRDASSRSRSGDDNFIVPQMSPPNIAAKRSRIFW